jgi:hypothetical protein
MYYNSRYKTWKQAFDEVNAAARKHEIIRAIASEIAGKPVENMVGFTNEDRDLVWNNYYNTTELCENFSLLQ